MTSTTLSLFRDRRAEFTKHAKNRSMKAKLQAARAQRLSVKADSR